MRHAARTGIRAVRAGAARLMDTVFGVENAGACHSPWPEEGCGYYHGYLTYLCCYYNCVGQWVCNPCDPPLGVSCSR